MLSDIIGFALASVVATVVVLVWHTSLVRSRFSAMTTRIAYLESLSAEFAKQLKQSANSKIAAEVAALRAEVEEERAEWAAQRSRLYGKLGALKREERAADPQPESAEEARARLRREHLLPLRSRS